MAGIHVANCNLVTFQGATLPQMPPVWSQSMDSPATTTLASQGEQSSVFVIDADVDAFVAVGSSPNAGNASGEGQNARLKVRAGTTREVFCRPGQKLSWVAAT